MFTGNRGCLVDDTGRVSRHHRGRLWIVCVTSYKDWRSPLNRPGRWTPIFFLDDAVALAAGHRPCGLCRRDDYLSYREAVRRGRGIAGLVLATDLNRMLAAERLARGSGLARAGDRKLWVGSIDDLADGVVIVADDGDRPLLVLGENLMEFRFGGWVNPVPRPGGEKVRVLTPPTSAIALANGYRAVLHSNRIDESAQRNPLALTRPADGSVPGS